MSGAPSISDIGALAADAGIRRVHVLAWRDLVDIEAGGSELHAARVMDLWAEAGLEITMRTSYAQGHPYTGERDGYKVIRKHGRFMVFPTAVLGEFLHRTGPRDAVVEIWNGVPFLTPLWVRGPRTTWIHHVHRDMWDMVLEPGLAKAGKFFEHRIAPPLYRRTPIITLSESSKHEIVEYLGLPAKRVSVVPPGIDERFSPSGPRSAEPLVVAVGRLMPSKRFDDLIDTMVEVRRNVPNAQLVIVGEGYERPALESRIESHDARSWIRLAGRVSDEELLSLYRRAWLVASTSVAEGWGMTLTEAAACGTPSVATDIPGHRDSVSNGRSGVLCGSRPMMVDELSSLLTDPGRLASLQRGALDHAATLTWTATALGTFAPLAADALRRRRS